MRGGSSEPAISGMRSRPRAESSGAANVGVAHYREVSGALVAEGGAAVIERIQVAPIGFQEFQSWVLLVLGLILSLLAFLDGFKLDDAYPQYGAHDRKLREVQHSYIAERGRIYDDLEDQLEEAVEDLKQAKQELGRWRREHLSILESRKRLFEAFDTQLDQLERVGNTLIGAYREANRVARPKGKVPKRFGESWHLDKPDIDRDPPETAMDAERFGDLVNRAEERLEAGVNSLHHEFRDAMEKFARLDHLVDSPAPPEAANYQASDERRTVAEAVGAGGADEDRVTADGERTPDAAAIAAGETDGQKA